MLPARHLSLSCLLVGDCIPSPISVWSVQTHAPLWRARSVWRRCTASSTRPGTVQEPSPAGLQHLVSCGGLATGMGFGRPRMEPMQCGLGAQETARAWWRQDNKCTSPSTVCAARAFLAGVPRTHARVRGTATGPWAMHRLCVGVPLVGAL